MVTNLIWQIPSLVLRFNMFRTNKVKRLLAVSSVLLMLSLLQVAVPPAHGYGKSALWQVTISGNCNNPSLCSSTSVGGFWVWAEFDSGSKGDATVTDCEHFGSTRPYGGAQHVNVEITGWTIAPGSAGPQTFFVTSEIDTITGHTGGRPVVINIPSELFDTGVPAVAGHYSTQDVLGFSAPGISFQIQVVQVG